MSEFSDLMPHRITVVSQGTRNDYGEIGIGSSTERRYRCLIDDSTTSQQTAIGEEIKYALTVYVEATPISKRTPMAINLSDTVTFDPVPEGQPSTRPLVTVEKHYWIDGSLHNMVLRFS